MFDVASFFVFITLMAFTPGPNNIMSMGNASRFGFRKSFRFNLGMWAGFSFVMLLCALASATLAAFIPKITIVMKIAGAAYMLWLAWHTFRSNGVDSGEDGRPTFAGGAFLQLVNPKIYVYGFTAMSSWIIPSHQGIPAIVAFALFLAFLRIYRNCRLGFVRQGIRKAVFGTHQSPEYRTRATPRLLRGIAVFVSLCFPNLLCAVHRMLALSQIVQFYFVDDRPSADAEFGCGARAVSSVTRESGNDCVAFGVIERS